MRNRKRKGRPSNLTVPRYPCGKIKPSARQPRGETEVQAMATAIAHRARVVGVDNAKRNEAGYELGRMFLKGRVTARQHRAGFDFASIVGDWQRMMGLPSPFPASMDYGAVRGLSIQAEIDADRVRRRTEEYMKMMTALSDAGRRAQILVRQVCVEDLSVVDVDNLRLGLDALADFFKIPAEPVDEGRPRV
ncbi:hypothetical protein V5F49_20440 [Xanthobacter sp. V3C-3]|uniref:hypothetical protein n=1 Tax=Xanthobacter lutulentifluminis TaxID=3119935 RepID=UPI00372C68D5